MTKEEIVKKVKRNARRFSMYGKLWVSVLELLEQDNEEKAITKLNTIYSISICGGNPDIMYFIGKLLKDLKEYKRIVDENRQ